MYALANRGKLLKIEKSTYSMYNVLAKEVLPNPTTYGCFVDAIILRSLGIGNNLAISYVGGGLLLPFGGLVGCPLEQLPDCLGTHPKNSLSHTKPTPFSPKTVPTFCSNRPHTKANFPPNKKIELL